VIAQALEKTEAACRKLVSRARERVKTDRPRHTVDRGQHQDLLQRFAAASASADTSALMKLFAPDVVLYSDGGGKAKAALNPIYGADKVTRFLAGVMGKFRPKNGFEIVLVEINGMPGFVLQEDGALHSALTVEFDGDTMSALYFVRNPDKLERINRLFSPGPSPSA
jgi:RNA polymerase sigma-70 factor (ECF subfamily)